METLPTELVVYIFHLLFEVLATPVDEGSHNMDGQVIVPFFHVPLVSKTFKRCYDECMHFLDLRRKELKIEWTDLLGKMEGRNFSWTLLNEEEPESREQVLKMLRSRIYYEQSINMLNKEVDLYRLTHNIVYRSPSNRIYAGFIGLKKLKQIKVTPLDVAKPWKVLMNRYDNTRKKAKVLKTKLNEHKMALRSKEMMKFLAKHSGQTRNALIVLDVNAGEIG